MMNASINSTAAGPAPTNASTRRQASVTVANAATINARPRDGSTSRTVASDVIASEPSDPDRNRPRFT